MAIQTINQGSIQTTPVGNTNRGFFAQLFNGKAIASEDFQRSEQSADNQLQRDLYLQNLANKFSAEEAEKARAYDREMSSSQYTRAVADLKKAGLNPVLALGGSGASFHGSSSASASSSRSSGGRMEKGFTDSNGAAVVNTLLGLAAGLVTKLPQKKYKIGFGN